MRAEEFITENLRKWFKEKWVRFGPDGKIRGACARGDDSEGKPKCLPQAKAHALGKKGRKYAASKKRREDPNPERRGPAKNVATKKKTDEGQIYAGGNKPAGVRWYKPRSVPNQNQLSKESAIEKGLQLEGADQEFHTGGGRGLPSPGTYEQETLPYRTKGQRRTQAIAFEDEQLDEKWSEKYKRSIDCNNPKGFSQKAHCQGRKK